jgi:hypothetical protein
MRPSGELAPDAFMRGPQHVGAGGGGDRLWAQRIARQAQGRDAALERRVERGLGQAEAARDRLHQPRAGALHGAVVVNRDRAPARHRGLGRQGRRAA